MSEQVIIRVSSLRYPSRSECVRNGRKILCDVYDGINSLRGLSFYYNALLFGEHVATFVKFEEILEFP